MKSVDEMLDCFEKKFFAAVTFCDLRKSFDCVPHKILVSKLKHLHVTRLALKVFETSSGW